MTMRTYWETCPKQMISFGGGPFFLEAGHRDKCELTNVTHNRWRRFVSQYQCVCVCHVLDIPMFPDDPPVRVVTIYEEETP